MILIDRALAHHTFPKAKGVIITLRISCVDKHVTFGEGVLSEMNSPGAFLHMACDLSFGKHEEVRALLKTHRGYRPSEKVMKWI